MPRQRNEDTGLYTETYPLERFTDELEAQGEATTREIADGIGCATETAYKKLRTLEERGDIESRMIARTRLWLVSEA